jgi:hypothetical protein
MEPSSPMRDEEDLLQEVLDVFAARTQPKKKARDEVGVSAIERFRVQMLSHGWAGGSHFIHGAKTGILQSVRVNTSAVPRSTPTRGNSCTARRAPFSSMKSKAGRTA